MLNNLKQRIRKSQNSQFVTEAAIDQIDEDLKDLYLDDIEEQIEGAEDDPEIEKLIDEIPEYDEDEINIDKDLENIEENFIPETNI